MRSKNLSAVNSSLLLAAVVVAFAAGAARAQETAPAAGQPEARLFAEKIDEYGKVGHCDLTARLDNFAIMLQNEPGTKGFVVSFDTVQGNRARSGWNLKVARHYLVEQRGIEPSRVVTVHGGSRDAKESLTELWVVPEGAPPPFDPPAQDKHTAEDFSGLFDSYVADEQIYRVMVEMGYPDEAITRSEFSHKLKQQPDSLGYLVIRPSKNSPPGAWRRLARRDEQILREYGVEPQRLRSVNGGASDKEITEVEFWVLPKYAPPPAAAEDSGGKAKEAYRLNTFEANGEAAGEAENWMLENLAEMLREDPNATAVLVAREPAEPIESVPDDETYAAEEPEEQPEDAGAETTEADAAEDETSGGAVESGEEEDASTMLELAAQWKRALETKYGIAAQRVSVVEGRRMPWSVGKLVTWVVPEKARPPDPNARDADEPEEDEPEQGAVAVDGAGEATVAPAPPRDE